MPTAPWNPSKATSYLIAGLTGWLPLYLIFFFAVISSTIVLGNSAGAEADFFSWIVPLHIATVIISFALCVVYVIHAVRSNAFDSQTRIVWVIVLFFANMLAFPVYWWLYMSPRRGRSAIAAGTEVEAGDLATADDDPRRRSVRRAGTICLGLGSFFLVWGCLGVIVGIAQWSSQPTNAPTSFLFQNFDAIFVTSAVAEAAAGLLLVLGGYGLKRMQPWGRLAAMTAPAIGIAYTVAFTAVFLGTAFTELSLPSGRFSIFPWVIALFGVVIAGLWSFVLYLPIRYFRSERVRAALSGAPLV